MLKVHYDIRCVPGVVNALYLTQMICFPFAKDFAATGCFYLHQPLTTTGRFNLWTLRRPLLGLLRTFQILFWSVCSSDLAVFLLAFRGVYNGNGNNEVSREATA